MAARTKQRLGLMVDERTAALSDEALFCRRFGHKWAVRAVSRKRFFELLDRGQQEDNFFCENSCGLFWRQLWDVRTGEVLEKETPKYPGNGAYLLPPGSGRLRRNEARVAQWARRNPGYS